MAPPASSLRRPPPSPRHPPVPSSQPGRKPASPHGDGLREDAPLARRWTRPRPFSPGAPAGPRGHPGWGFENQRQLWFGTAVPQRSPSPVCEELVHSPGLSLGPSALSHRPPALPCPPIAPHSPPALPPCLPHAIFLVGFPDLIPPNPQAAPQANPCPPPPKMIPSHPKASQALGPKISPPARGGSHVGLRRKGAGHGRESPSLPEARAPPAAEGSSR